MAFTYQFPIGVSISQANLSNKAVEKQFFFFVVHSSMKPELQVFVLSKIERSRQTTSTTSSSLPMPKTILRYAVALLACQFVVAHAGSLVREGEKFKSDLLSDQVRYSIYLPAAYQRDHNRRFPVVYLLHGYPTIPHNSDIDWIQQGNVDHILDQAINSGAIPPLIVVMPDIKRSWAVDGDQAYGTMLASELVPHIDETYRTRRFPQFRAIAGLSMGGFGALSVAMKNPKLFSASVGLSAGIYTSDELTEFSDEIYADAFAPWIGRGLVGNERINEAWRQNNPLYLAESLPLEDLKATRWYLDIGDDDFLYTGNAALHILLRDREIPHEYRVRDGGHDWSYWRKALPDALAFIADSYW
jgi:enterochelin esterase-like enzyme